MPSSYKSHIEAAIEQNMQMQKDAARYQFLRSHLYSFLGKFPHDLAPAQMDSVVDTQMQGVKK